MTAEVVAFALGGFSTMPAVQNFSICAALAVFLDFCLQVRLRLLGMSLSASCPPLHLHKELSCMTPSL